MKRAFPYPRMALLLALVALAACGSRVESEGNINENMAIFSLIAIVAFAIIAISFGGDQGRGRLPAAPERQGEGGSTSPLTAADLTGRTVYVCDSPGAFRKMVFDPDGIFLASPKTSTSGVDPPATTAGIWMLTFDGMVRIVLAAPGKTMTYARIGREADAGTAQMRSETGIVETWYFGPRGLAGVQAACFGHSATVSPTEREAGGQGKDTGGEGDTENSL